MQPLTSEAVRFVEHLGPVLRQHGDAGAARHARGSLGLDQLAGPARTSAYVATRPARRMHGSVVVGVEAADDEVGEQRRVVEGRVHVPEYSRHQMFSGCDTWSG